MNKFNKVYEGVFQPADQDEILARKKAMAQEFVKKHTQNYGTSELIKNADDFSLEDIETILAPLFNEKGFYVAVAEYIGKDPWSEGETLIMAYKKNFTRSRVEREFFDYLKELAWEGAISVDKVSDQRYKDPSEIAEILMPDYRLTIVN